MASNPRFRSIYYNTTGTSVQWQIDICDTEAVSQIINFESHNPILDMEGMTEKIESGIYPSSFKFNMYIRDSPKNVFGTTQGPSASLISDLFGSNEGRFRVKLYQDGVIKFIGVILPDQCSYEDLSDPYLLRVVAADGLYRLSTEDYISQVGQIKYETIRSWAGDLSEFSSTPLAAPAGTEWVMITHHSVRTPSLTSARKTTYVRYEQYRTDTPGTGWVDQGGSLWAKEVDYFNEVIIDEMFKYHLTRDIDNAVRRQLSEYISRAMAIIPTMDEYGEDIMYDVVNPIYETAMYDLTADPYTMTRYGEGKFAVGEKWSKVCETILLHNYARLYYSNGRYHWECISSRGDMLFDRFCYDNTGTLVSTETAQNLDLSYSGLSLSVEAGGTYKILAALRLARFNVQFEGSNLLNEQSWDLDHEGSRYLGRIKTTQADTRFGFALEMQAVCQYIGINGFPHPIKVDLTSMSVDFDIRVSITNLNTGTTYYATPEDPVDYGTPTWETDEVNGFFAGKLGLIWDENEPIITAGSFTLKFLSDQLPGSVGDSYDVYISVSFVHTFYSQIAIEYWDAHPDDLNLFAKTNFAELLLKDQDSNLVDAEIKRVYETINSLDNTYILENDATFTDFGVGGGAIEVLTSATPITWSRSRVWNRFGVVSGSTDLLTLLTQEQVAVRQFPLRLYSGGFITHLISTENRINRDSLIYLPLNVSINTDVDLCSGQFLHLERSDPPAGDTVGTPVEESNDGPTFFGGIDPPVVSLVLETNEVISGNPTLTELDIVNSIGAYIPAGETVTIINTTTGQFENVTLTADINPVDTIMYFESNAFTYDYPDASPIVLSNGYVENEFGRRKYYYKNDLYNGFTHTIPNVMDLDFVTGLSLTQISKKIRVMRNGTEMPLGDYTDPALSNAQFWFYDAPANELSWEFEFEDEQLIIDIDMDR